MILYFLRHGDAGPRRATDDDARTLTDSGIVTLRAAAGVWRRVDVRPEVVLSSPLPRAVRTAELVCEGLGLDTTPIVADALRPGATWGDMARALAAHADARSVMLVGHEPDLSRAAALLSGASSVGLRASGMVCLEFPGVPEPGGGELVWLLDPDLYAGE